MPESMRYIREELEKINTRLDMQNSKMVTAVEKMIVQDMAIQQLQVDYREMRPVVEEARQAAAVRTEIMKTFDSTVKDVRELVEWMNQQKGRSNASQLIGSAIVGLLMGSGAFVATLVAVKQYLHP